MRLFVAIDVPDGIIVELHRLQSLLIGAKLRRVSVFHLTLKFLGEVADVHWGEEQLNKIKFESFKTCLNNMGVFPNEKYIRVVWVGLTPKGLLELQQQVETVLGYGKGERFVPHLTLARVGMVADKQRFQQLLKSIDVVPVEFSVDNFKLIQSTLTPKGPIYKTLKTYPAEAKLL
ncbi:MAG: RNA 2',3'-cyclic phosphodiesterase [Candidatus Woesearchaeota archaeon]